MSGDKQSRLPVVLIVVLGVLLAGGVAVRLLMDDGAAVPHAHAGGAGEGMGEGVRVGEGKGRGRGRGKGKSPDLYTCGMHPNVVQEGPGICPICNMDLTPMKGSTAGGGDGKTVTVDPVMVQNMGVRVARVKTRDLTRRVRTIGEVVVAEDLVSVVNLKFSGWVERLYVDKTGVKVRKGQALMTIHSPELVAAQEEYLLALRGPGKESPLARSARARLAFWDLGEATLGRLEKGGKARRTITVRAPRSGFVLHKNVIKGARVMAGADLMRIGRLDAIWVQAQLYEWDAPWVRVGQPAAMELSFARGKQYAGKVSYIYPTLNPKTRTLTVRLEFSNRGLQLKPGMFTTVRIQTRERAGVLAIPTEAIIHSGERTLVFVSKGVGRYEPRPVATGLSGEGHLTEVTEGLEAGEVVVVSGQFLLDSESQLQEATQKLMAARLQAKGAAAPKWTCPMHDNIVEDEAGECPICGMNLEKKQ